MAEDDVTIGITVEDSAAMVKLAELQAEMAKVQQPTEYIKWIESTRPATTLLERATAAAKANREESERTGIAMRNFAQAEDEVGEAAGRAGINIESMMTRMAIRMAIMEVARLAIGGVVNAFKEMAALETARVQFENLTIAMEQANEVEQSLAKTTLDTNVAFKDLSPAIISLEDAGEGPLQAAADVDTLAKISAETGIPIKELSKGLLDLKLDKAPVEVLFQMAHASGEAKDAMVAQVQEYAELERSIKLADHARDDELATMREQVAVQEQFINEEIRAAEVEEKAAVQRINDEEKAAAAQEKAVERQISAQEKLAGVQQGFLEKVLGAEGKPPGQADPMLQKYMRAAGGEQGILPHTEGAKKALADIQLGFNEIYKEEGLTREGMQHFVDTGVIGYRDIMAAAKRAHEEEKQGRSDASAAAKKTLEDEKTVAEKKLADIKTEGEAQIRNYQQTIANMAKEDAATKKKERVDLDNARLSLEKQITDEVLKQENHTKELTKAMGTLGEQLKTVWTSLGAIAQSQQGQGFLGVLSEFIGLNDLRRAAPGLQAAAAKLTVKEENSDKIEGHLNTIAGALTGQGTP